MSSDLTDADRRAADARGPEGRIGLCPHQACNFCCTEFTSGNYIVLYPGELEKARAAGLSVSHLKLIDEQYHGGARAICEATEHKNCDGGYKPLDCASYPLFPRVAAGDTQVTRFLKGTKCPLTAADIGDHEAWVTAAWNRLIADDESILHWLRRVRLVGYEPVPSGRIIPLVAQHE
jgi:Fe-S-cluster containining protein